MDEDYEQMDTSHKDDKIFFQTKKRNTYHEIVKNKNKFCKYCVIFGSLIFMIILSIFLVTKSSQLTLLKAQNNKLKDELSAINSREYNLKEEYSKLNSEKTSLSKENENLNNEIQEYEKKNKRLNEENQLNTQKISSLQKEQQEIDNKISEINKKNDDYQKKILELNDKNKEYITKIENLKKQITEIQKKIEEIENDKKEENIDFTSLNSKIIKSKDQLNTISKMFNLKEKYSLKLLYQATKDGYNNKIFHEKCDNIKNTITLIQDYSNLIIGGYTSESWNGKGFKSDSNAFIFNLSNMKKYEVYDFSKAIYADPDYLTIFGQSDIYMSVSSASSHFPTSYGKFASKLELTNGIEKITPVEMEVFQLVVDK